MVVDAISELQRVAVHAHDDARHEIATSGAIEKLLRLICDHRRHRKANANVNAEVNGGVTSSHPLVEPAMSALQNLSAVVKPNDWVKFTMDQQGVPQLMLQMIHARVEVAKSISTLMNLIIGTLDQHACFMHDNVSYDTAPNAFCMHALTCHLTLYSHKDHCSC